MNVGDLMASVRHHIICICSEFIFCGSPGFNILGKGFSSRG